MDVDNLSKEAEYDFKDEIEQQRWNWELLVEDFSELKNFLLSSSDSFSKLDDLVRQKIQELQIQDKKAKERLENLIEDFNDKYKKTRHNLKPEDKNILRGIIAGFYDMELAQRLYPNFNSLDFSDEKKRIKHWKDVQNQINVKFNDQLRIPIQLLLFIKGSPLGYEQSLNKAKIRTEFERLGYRDLVYIERYSEQKACDANSKLGSTIEQQACKANKQQGLPIEQQACDANSKPGSLIRIKAPKKMGKTFLLNKILKDARINKGFKTVIFNFDLLSDDTYKDYEKLSQNFCFTVSEELDFDSDQTENWLTNNWKKRLDTNQNTDKFLKDYLLPKISVDLVLALKNFDKVLENENISKNFCNLLRDWYDQSKRETSNIWDKLHLIIIHSTDVYGSKDINSSPLCGVGEYFELKMFNSEQVKELITKSHVSLNDNQIKQLIDLIGGHPYLLVEAIKALKKGNITLEILLEQAPTENGIFSDHLRELLDILKRNNHLKEAYKEVVNSDDTPVELLDPYVAFKLYSLGLIKLEGDMASPSNNLYKEYFKKRLI